MMKRITIFLTILISAYGLYAQDGIGSINAKGDYSTNLGVNAGLKAQSTSYNNSNFGYNAGRNTTTGFNNTCIGTNAGLNNTVGFNNTFVGVNSGYENIKGENNTFIGLGAGRFNTDGNSNTFVGISAGSKNSIAQSNSFFGATAGFENTTGEFNSFFGKAAGRNNSTGSFNVFVGVGTGANNTSANSNSFFGYNAGNKNTVGKYNTFLGQSTGRSNTTGSNNTFVGREAGFNNEIGNSNIFVGEQAGYNETGSNKLYIDNSGTDKPLIYGDFSSDKLTFNGSVGIGENIPVSDIIPKDIKLYVDGRFTQKLSGNIGSFSENDKWSSLGESFAPPGIDIPNIYGMFNVWGNRSFTSGIKEGQHGVVSWGGPAARLDFDFLDENANNETYMSIASNGNVGIGTINPVRYKLQVAGDISSTGIFTNSDKRYKENVESIESALEKIEALHGRSYHYKQEEVNNINFQTSKAGKQYGLIAQEVEQVLPELVKKDEAGYYAVNYDGLIPVLIEGMKEQQSIIEELSTRMELLEAQLNIQKQANPSEDLNKNNAISSSIVLEQNNPNPLSTMTNIEYAIPENLSNASLRIYDMTGRQIANYPISGKGNLTIDAKDLTSGTYTYSIVANGENIVSRKMVVQ